MYILEIGIGRGGSYIDTQKQSIDRVGVDRKLSVLRMLRRGHPNVHPCLTTFYHQGDIVIPFATDSIDSIEFRFPHDDLMYWLVADGIHLWTEMKRILTPGGHVMVLFDVPPDKTRELAVRSEARTVQIIQPEDHMWRIATDYGFDVHIRKLTKQEVYDDGSIYGKCAAHWIKESNDFHSVYVLTAEKLPILSGM